MDSVQRELRNAKREINADTIVKVGEDDPATGVMVNIDDEQFF